MTHPLWDIVYVARPFGARVVRDMPSLLQSVRDIACGYMDKLAISLGMPKFNDIACDLGYVE